MTSIILAELVQIVNAGLRGPDTRSSTTKVTKLHEGKLPNIEPQSAPFDFDQGRLDRTKEKITAGDFSRFFHRTFLP
jgi:hypothetical protein